MKKVNIFASLILLLAILLGSCGEASLPSESKTETSKTVSEEVLAAELMNGIIAGKIDEKAIDTAFVDVQKDFAIKLFKQSLHSDESTLISPISVMLALAMTANGASGDTKAEMETLLGGGIPLEELNNYLYSYTKNLPSSGKCRLDIANSIWFRDEDARLTVEKDFLQKNADYYNAAAYKVSFNDPQTVTDINNWVKNNTDGLIDKIIDNISIDTVMYLINAVVFDAEWETAYEAENIKNGTFTNISGVEKEATMMMSLEYNYISDGKATGFIKNYKGGKYAFVALLPDDGDINSYISSLTGSSFSSAISSAAACSVAAYMPKFSYSCDTDMNDILKSLGIPLAFDCSKADFSQMAHSSDGNIFIGDVLHKTFIAVDELGTKAGAVTKVEMTDECCMMPDKTVSLDRPFVYAIIDSATGIPLFIGALTDVN